MRLIAVLITLLAAAPAWAQAPAPAPSPVTPVAPADTNDVRLSTPDSVIANLYRVISGPAGQRRDWTFFQQLFLPEGGLMAVGQRYRPGRGAYIHMTPASYAAGSGPYLEERGFFERETHREAAQYALVYHAFSTYESRATPDAEPFARGINSIQLVKQQGRWWVLSVLWTDEQSSGTPIPEAYRGR